MASSSLIVGGREVIAQRHADDSGIHRDAAARLVK